MSDVFAGLVGQERAAAQLRAAAAAPVHAYLFAGPPGSGKRLAARAFGAALLCPQGGCGTCRDCTLALAEVHPDLVMVEREGASISKDQIDQIIRLAWLSPTEAARRVLVPVDFHLVQQQAPRLLKTVEEPPATTVFVILAEDVPPELVTIASRCVRIDFRPVPTDAIAAWLEGEGVEPDRAAEIAPASGGRLDRARLLASDPGFGNRRRAWRDVPRRIDRTGASVAVAVAELQDQIAQVVNPLQQLQTDERARVEEQAGRYGDRRQVTAQLRRLDERHKREQRRVRTDELRFGLATLEGVYRDALAAGAEARGCVDAIAAITAANRDLVRNPNETLLLQALLLRLSECPAGLGAPA